MVIFSEKIQLLTCRELNQWGLFKWFQDSDSSEGSERTEESCLSFREYINNHELNVHRHMDGRGCSGEISHGNEEHMIENWRKGHPWAKVAKNWPALCCSFSPWMRNATLLDIKFSYICLFVFVIKIPLLSIFAPTNIFFPLCFLKMWP